MRRSHARCPLLSALLGGVLLLTPGGSRGQEPGGGVPVDPAAKRFGELDTDKDGRLSRDESMGGSGRLGRAFDQWDANKDGYIDLDEYRLYYAAANGLPPPDVRPEQRDTPKPVVYRYGSVPANLPGWFTEADADRDGQIGLYEWVKHWGNGEAKLAEFKELDLNGDGLLTVEEYLRAKKLTAAPVGPPGGAAKGVPPNTVAPPGGPPAWGPPPVAVGPVRPAADPPKADTRGREPKRGPDDKK